MPGIIIVESMAAKTKPLPGKFSRAKAKPASEQKNNWATTMLAERMKLFRIQRGKYEFPFASGSAFQTSRNSGSATCSARRSAARPALHACVLKEPNSAMMNGPRKKIVIRIRTM